MATVNVIKLKLRRGLDSERKLVTLDNGELGYVTDAASRRLFVGDGVTKGGFPAGNKFYYNANVNTGAGLVTAQVGDLVFSVNTGKLYTLSGSDAFNFPDYSNPDAYQFVGAKTDGLTVSYTAGGSLQVNTNGVSAAQINSSAYDLTQGLARTTSTSPVKVNYDNVKIQIISGALSVNEANLNINNFNYSGKTMNGTDLAISSLPTSVGGLRSGQLWRDVGAGNIIKVAP